MQCECHALGVLLMRKFFAASPALAADRKANYAVAVLPRCCVQEATKQDE